MTKNKMRILNILMAMIVFITIIIAYQIAPITTVAESVNFIVTVLSLIIALFAFIVAMMTYTSIDSVNNVTRMDGNVLENEDYTTSFNAILYTYEEDNPIELRNHIFRELNQKFKKESKTAIAFSNNLQYFIDLIVIFPLLFKTENERQENMDEVDKLIALIKKQKMSLDSVSLGNLRLIEETVKLIEAVMDYQKLTHRGKKVDVNGILKVRGTMIKNAVTRTVYYNYLGLFYYKMAMNVIKESHSIDDGLDLFSLEGHQKLLACKEAVSMKEKDRELLTIFLNESKKAFQIALKNSDEDKMWAGFITYNDARVTYFLYLFSIGDEHSNWEKLLNDAIIARTQFNILIGHLLGNKKTFIQEEFIYQEYLARIVKMNIFITKKRNITDTNGKDVYFAPHYENLLKDRFINEDYHGPSKHIKRYQQEIREYCKKREGF